MSSRTLQGAVVRKLKRGLRTLPRTRLQRLPRMADFALWAAACETSFWPSGTFENAYWDNRRAAIENVIHAGPVATGVREIMATRVTWSGSASEARSCRCSKRSGTLVECGLAENRAGACRSTTAGADVPAHAGHRA
jgi:hypothetical protein